VNSVSVSFEFEESTYYTGPTLTDEMIEAAQTQLGRRLPQAYVALLRAKNGGRPVRRCIQTAFRTSWAGDHIEINAIRGIGGTWGIGGDGPLSSAAMIEEWGYPKVGIVICDMPSGGHDAIMLDYADDVGEPSVVYIDEDRKPRTIAESFSEFLNLLRRCEDILGVTANHEAAIASFGASTPATTSTISMSSRERPSILVHNGDGCSRAARLAGRVIQRAQNGSRRLTSGYHGYTASGIGHMVVNGTVPVPGGGTLPPATQIFPDILGGG
jgi:hypothetical protein